MRTYSSITIALFIVVFSFSGTTFAQTDSIRDSKEEVYKKIHIPDKKPIPYPYTREADVMWSKIVWRMVDLREKMNFPLYFPTRPIGDRMNLIQLIFKGIDEGKIQVYNPDKGDDEFKFPMTKEGLDRKMGNVPHAVPVPQADGTVKMDTVPGERRYTEIKKVLLKEKWFFDSRYSKMEVRILGICPIRLAPKEIKGTIATGDSAEIEQRKVCWVYYPESRDLFSTHPIYNARNDAQQTSFDDFFMQRRFNSYIYATSNVYNNRTIDEYTTGMESLLEADRIKNSLVNDEQDFWEY
ncbi:MAG: gliding motility protein GldN [Bacteroidota bacterium]|nr:gliding motility protein GldN [Bacteroidota bacterium]